MGYSKGGTWQNTDDVVLFGDGTVATATRNGDPLEVGMRSDACLELVVTAASGTTPTLDVKLQTSKDGSGTGLGAWRDVASFAQATGAASERKSFSGLDRFVRAVATVGGTTPSFTFSVKGETK
jgi:hypothetical protein